MKLILISLLICASLHAQDSQQLGAELKAKAAANWPAIEDLLKAQRSELVAAHEATLKQVAIDNKAAADALIAAKKALEAGNKATADQLAAAKAALEAAAVQMRNALPALAEVRNAEEKTGKGPKWQKLADAETSITTALDITTKTEQQKRREQLAAEIAAKQAELARLKP